MTATPTSQVSRSIDGNVASIDAAPFGAVGNRGVNGNSDVDDGARTALSIVNPNGPISMVTPAIEGPGGSLTRGAK